VTSDWFEQIGIDLDMYFNTNNGMFQAARAVDPNFNLSDFFFQEGTNRGEVKDPIIFAPSTVIPMRLATPTLPRSAFRPRMARISRMSMVRLAVRSAAATAGGRSASRRIRPVSSTPSAAAPSAKASASRS